MSVFRDLCDLLHRRKRRRTTRPGTASGMLLISSGGLGDTILFSVMVPIFAKLSRAGERIDIVVQNGAEAVQFLYPDDVNLIGLDYRRFIRDTVYRYRFCERLFAAHYRVAVSTDHLRLPTVDDTLIGAADADQAFALTPRSWDKHNAALRRNRRDYTDWIEPSEGMAHRLVRWWELADGLIDGEAPLLPTVQFDGIKLPAAESHEQPYIVLHPFSSERARQHAPATWFRLVDGLAKRYRTVVSAGPGDIDRNPAFRELLAVSGVSLDERGLQDKCALMRGAALVISVDTSVMHLAAGAGARTICLASAAHVVDSIPYDPRIVPDNVTFLYHDMDCRGCLGACIHSLEDGRFPCVQRLNADRVIDAVQAALNP